MTFRDLTNGNERPGPLHPGPKRWNTVFTCFLEYEPDYVRVHDLVYERTGDSWQFRKSSYPKLRISLAWAIERLEATGFKMESTDTDKGMITLIAEKCS